jgi:signal transduction histidine kinase
MILLIEKEKQQFLNKLAKENQLIFEYLDHGILIVDEQFVILHCNHQMEKLLKVEKNAILYKPFLKNTAFSERLYHLLVQAQEKKTLQTCFYEVNTSKKTYLEILALPLSKAILLIVKDQSCHFKIREMGKEFIANASHELRTPITIIRGFAETLRDMSEISGAMLEDIIEKILRNCERMNVLVKNLLLLADLDYLPKTRLSLCDPRMLIEGCADHILSIHPEVIISINGPTSLKILADPELLELAFANILQNAVKYSKPPAQISIYIEEKHPYIRFNIQDKGIGIPESEIDYIFDRFHTVDKTHSRKLGGAGLGLSIVKNIVDRHEGRIWATSTIGKGTTFTIELKNETVASTF